MASFKISINDNKYSANADETILEIAKRENIYIPALCAQCDLEVSGSCRLCLVEVKGEKNLIPSCSLKAKEGMSVYTNTPYVQKALKINLELLFAQHEGKCESCFRKGSCKLLELATKNRFESKKYLDRKKVRPTYQFGPSIKFDSSKCINCQNCTNFCQKQTQGGFLKTKDSKYSFEVLPSTDKNLDCIFCGQCIAHCPVAALSEVTDYEKVRKLLLEKKKKVIFQFAPSIRTSLGEEFGLKSGTNVTKKIYLALDKIGAFKIFDTSFGADMTIMEESEELVNKIRSNSCQTMFSSCCPAWVKYVEFYEPSLIKNLTTVRSPQIILGGLIKTYWAKKENIKPKDIVVVSIMPCTAKKFEIKRKELSLGNMPPVDYVLTTRETARLLRDFEVDLKEIDELEFKTELFQDVSGAGEIFGASGGVLEAAIRTAFHKLTGKELDELEFKDLKEKKGIKVLDLNIAGRELKMAAVNGIENAKKIIKEIKEDPKKYSCVEIMACPGGCIGGGGQPLPVDDEKRAARAKGLYTADQGNRIRRSHQNEGVLEVYKEFLTTEKLRCKICHTHFLKKKKSKIKKVNN